MIDAPACNGSPPTIDGVAGASRRRHPAAVRLRIRLVRQPPSPAARVAGQAAIRAHALARGAGINRPMFHRIVPSDLALLFEAYDARFFDGAMREALDGPTGGALTFDVSRRMIRSGGMTRREERRGPGGVERRFSIGVSATLLGGTFRGEARAINVCGVRCEDRLDALLRIFEHELIHLCEFLVWQASNCRGRPFARFVHGFFGHTEATHELVTPHERARQALGVGVGSRVRFRAGRRVHEGVVNRITRRATVLVPDPGGRRYSDGQCYAKYYVPIEALEPAE